MWKLLLPKSTAASTCGTGRGALRGEERVSAGRRLAAVATRTAAASGSRERGAAAASGGGVRVADHELRAIKTLAVVDLRAGEVLHAHRVDEQLDAEVLDAGVAVLQLLIELEAVLQPRAAPALHEHAQHELRVALAADEVADLAGGSIGELVRRGILQRFGRSHRFHTYRGVRKPLRARSKRLYTSCAPRVPRGRGTPRSGGLRPRLEPGAEAAPASP